MAAVIIRWLLESGGNLPNLLSGNAPLMQHAGGQDIHIGFQQSADIVRIPDSAGRGQPAIRPDFLDPLQKFKIRSFHGTDPVQAHDDDAGRPGAGLRPDFGSAAKAFLIEVERQDRVIVRSRPTAGEFGANDRAEVVWKTSVRIRRWSGIDPEFDGRMAAA